MTEILVRKGATILPRKPRMPMEWVGEYSRSGHLQAVYPDIKSASKHTGITPGKIKKCMDGKIPFIEETFYLPYDYTQSNESLVFNIQKRENSLISPQTPKKTDKIFQYDLEGNFIASFVMTVEASKETGASQSAISQNVNGKINSANGFIFMRFKSEETDEEKRRAVTERLQKKDNRKKRKKRSGTDEDVTSDALVQENEKNEIEQQVKNTKKQTVSASKPDKEKDEANPKPRKKYKPRKELVDIYLFDDKGRYVKTFKNVQEIFHELGMSSTTVRNVCEGKSRGTNNGVFLLKEDYPDIADAKKEVEDRLNQRNIPKRHRKLKLSQFTADGIFIREYDSIRDAAELLDIQYVRINQSINGYTKSVNGYVFLYSEDYESRDEMVEDIRRRQDMKTSELKHYVRERRQYRYQR